MGYPLPSDDDRDSGGQEIASRRIRQRFQVPYPQTMAGDRRSHRIGAHTRDLHGHQLHGLPGSGNSALHDPPPAEGDVRQGQDRDRSRLHHSGPPRGHVRLLGHDRPQREPDRLGQRPDQGRDLRRGHGHHRLLRQPRTRGRRLGGHGPARPRGGNLLRQRQQGR